jgi:hypothetical protein
MDRTYDQLINSADGGETVAGSAGIDVAYSSSQGHGSSWLV